MNLRLKMLALAVLCVAISGCQGRNGPGMFGGPGLLSNVNGSRIAPPGTNEIRYPQVANLPDPYYGQRPPTTTTQPGNPNGWRPFGTNAVTAAQTGATYNPSSDNIQNATPNLIPSNNVVVASTTSSIRPTNQVASNTQPNGQVGNRPTVQVQPTRPNVQVPVNTVIPNNGSQVASNSVTGGMPLNDATQFGTRGILSRASEYVARPNTITRNGYNPNYGQVAANAPTFNRPAVNYGNPGYRYPQNVNPGYQAYPNNGNVAQQWRQRDTR